MVLRDVINHAGAMSLELRSPFSYLQSFIGYKEAAGQKEIGVVQKENR